MGVFTTISTQASSSIVACNGSSQSFQFGFIADSASAITVSSIASSGTITPLLTSQYTLSINAPATNQLWGVGGTVTTTAVYPLGSYLQISRILPLTQTTSVQNQGNYYAQVTEQALDTLCMEIQQVAARTGLIRGAWATGVSYNFGDIVQDGANGNNSLSYYTCAIANTSTVWATDLAAGDWSLSINSTLPSTPLPLSVANGGTGVTTSTGTGSVVLNNSPTLVSPTLGIANASSLNVTGSGAVSNGIYLSAANTVALASRGLPAITITNPALAVNYIHIDNGANGSYPSIEAVGTDANIGFNFDTQGAGSHNFNTNLGFQQFQILHTANAVNSLTITGAVTNSSPTLQAIGSDTNVGVNYKTKGSGVHTFTGAVTLGTALGVPSGGTGDTGTAWTSYTPGISSQGGAITSVSASGRYKTIGKTCFVEGVATITTNGTGASGINFGMPLVAGPGAYYVLNGCDIGTTNNSLHVAIPSAGTSASVYNYNNGYPGSNGSVLAITGVYETV